MTKWAGSMADLSRDRRSGAAELEARALELLIEMVGDSSPGNSAPEYRRWLQRVGRELMGAQPAMATLFRLVNDMLWACDRATLPEEIRQQALNFLQHRQANQEAALQAVAHAAAGYLAEISALMTYSRSPSVALAFQLLAKRGSAHRIYCSEARPMLEGQTLASELSWAGLDVVIGIDMALFGWLSEVKALVLGADSLGSSGVVGKIGVAQLVRAAAEREIPRILLCATRRFVPDAYRLADALPVHDPEEIMPTADRVEIRNTYYEITPLEAFSVVITETGVHELAQVRAELAMLRIYPGLQGRQDTP